MSSCGASRKNSQSVEIVDAELLATGHNPDAIQRLRRALNSMFGRSMLDLFFLRIGRISCRIGMRSLPNASSAASDNGLFVNLRSLLTANGVVTQNKSA